MRITTIMNQKGGVGKSTSAHALATGLRQRGYKTLVIDADPQSTLSFTYGVVPSDKGLHSVMRGDTLIFDAITHTNQGDILSSNLDLCSADMEFTRQGREFILREALEQIKDKYDHVVIDSPPSLGILNINALTASTDVVIPLGADVYSMHGLQQLLRTIDTVKKYSNPSLCVAGLLVCRRGVRANITAEMIELIRESASANNLHAYNAIIREATAIREAQLTGKSIYEYAPKAAVTGDYNDFLEEYLEQEAFINGKEI